MTPSRMTARTALLFATLLGACALSACGQKGALYLPGDEREKVGNTPAAPQQSPNTAPAATPAPAPVAGTTTDEASARSARN